MFDEPYTLLQSKECSLLKLVKETGEVEASELKDIAKHTWERKQGVQYISEPQEISDANEDTSVIYRRIRVGTGHSEDIEEDLEI